MHYASKSEAYHYGYQYGATGVDYWPSGMILSNVVIESYYLGYFEGSKQRSNWPERL